MAQLTEEAKLNFLRDYIVRARFDAMLDKATLTQLFYFKIIACGGALSMASTGTGVLVLMILPFVIFSIDFMHKKRFLEIFLRWENVVEQCIPAARGIEGFWTKDSFEFLEEHVVALKETLANEESVSRAVLATAVSGLSVPAFVLTAQRLFGAATSHTIPLMFCWLLVIAIVFHCSFIASDKYCKTYPNKSWSVPIGLAFITATLALLNLAGWDIVAALDRTLSPHG